MTAEHVEIVRAWHEALNTGNMERVLALSHGDIALAGPRGSGRGAEVLRAWFDRSGVRIVPRQVFHRGQVVVVEQEFTWPESGAPGDVPPLASVFVVRDRRIVSIQRHRDLAAALAATGLTDADRA